jgi:hypothetical protein
MKMFIGSMFALLLAIQGQASASGQFDVIGPGCVPDSTAIFGATYANANGGVSHATAKTGTVTLHCPITNAASFGATGVKTLRTVTTDNSLDTGNQVVVTLYKLNNTTGAASVVAVVNSDNCQQGGVRVCATSFSEPFDTTNNFYFLGVYIARTNTSTTETFWGASLF